MSLLSLRTAFHQSFYHHLHFYQYLLYHNFYFQKMYYVIYIRPKFGDITMSFISNNDDVIT